jgi:two-component system, response regulator
MTHAKTILLVEDNADDEVLTLRALERSQVAQAVIVARDGVEALDYLFGTGDHDGRDTSVQPDLVLMDLNLPRLGGIGVLDRMRADERTRLIPVVVLTSSRQEEDIVKSYSSGANAYIRKPVEFDRFLDAVRTLGLFWLVMNQPAPPRRP